MIITIANQKGGTGKTTLATHLATWRARQGKRIVLVDLDTQGSVAPFLGLTQSNDVAELLQTVINVSPERRPPFRSFLCGVPNYENLVIIRGWNNSAFLEADLRRPGIASPCAVLREALWPILQIGGVDIVIDTGPYAGMLQEAALTVADHVIVPGIPEAATESGILDIARRLQALGRSITAVIPTKVMPDAREHRKTMEDWVATATLGRAVYYDRKRKLLGLPRRIIWGETVRYGQTIWDYAPRDQAAQEMETIVRRICYDAKIE